MVSFILKSPYDVRIEIAMRARTRRLDMNLTQKTLSERSGVSYGSLKKFEQTGKISLDGLLKLALVLGELEGFEGVFAYHANKLPNSISELLVDNTRQRGRK